jgi:ABC-type dipeptide/oligopeptide/nickel transport system ATPase component
MEQVVRPFEKFLPGSHLLIGEAGSGKTRLIWSILQERDYAEDDSINIVLTDSEKRIWSGPTRNPIITLNPYDTNISWVTEPTKPGIYYCACDYAPRIITFLECLATWAIQNEKNLDNKVRIFVDFPTKFWALPEFVEQLNRLHYIIASQDSEDTPIEIWSVFCSLKKITSEARILFKDVNLVLLNPFPSALADSICKILDLKCENLPGLLARIDHELKDGFYYIPSSEEAIYLQPKAIEKL